MSRPAPILALPGLLCTAALWEDSLGGLGLEVLSPPYPPAGTLAGIAAALLHAAPPRILVIGHSMGGYIAFELLRQAPERIAGLCLIGATAAADGPDQAAARDKAVAQAERAGMASFAARIGAWLMPPPAPALPRFIAMAEATGIERFRAQQAAIAARAAGTPLLAGIAVPTLIVTGAADPLFPPDAAAALAAAIPGAACAILPDAGHLPPIEAPAALADALRPWLARCDAATPTSITGAHTP
jgi:pimeloyl-ACP methyl ester carboxylesterase